MHDFAKSLHDVVGRLGKVKAIKATDQHACDDAQCFTFAIAAAKGKGTATFELTYVIARWQVTTFNVDAP